MTYAVNSIGIIAGTKTIASFIVPGAAALIAGGAVWVWLSNKKVTTQANEMTELRQQMDETRKEKQDLSAQISKLQQKMDTKQTSVANDSLKITQSHTNTDKDDIFKSIFYENIQLKSSLS